MWLNDVFLGSTKGASNNNDASVCYLTYFFSSSRIHITFIQSIIETTNQTYSFPEGAVTKGQDNVITVLHDDVGMEEAGANRKPLSAPFPSIILTLPNSEFLEWLKTPRGIQGYFLLGPNGQNQPTWKVQGKLGGYSEYVVAF